MKKYHLLSLILIVFVLFSSCESNSDDEVIISGTVVNANTNAPVTEAVVRITAPQDFLNESRVTDDLGAFTFSGLNVNEATDIVLQIGKTGFVNATVTVPATPGQTINLENPIELSEEGGDGDGDGDGGGGVAGPSAGPAQIILTNITNQAINIAETGDQISSPFTFQVQDSSGRALTSSNPATVNFSIITGPGGGEEITPSSLQTNANGEVTTALFSGNRAGSVKIQASITRDDGTVVRSTPVLIAIHGGFPDQQHFSLALRTSNIEGYNINNTRTQVDVIMGDEFSNPVKPGTVVYFRSTGGVMQGSGSSDDDGFVSVELISAAPRPSENIPGSGGRPGYGYVIAQTVDKNDDIVSDSAIVLFSGLPQITNVNPTTFDIPPNGGASFTFTATDQNGNPLAAGTQFAVEVGEGLDANGDANFDLGDYLFPGTGSTQFAFSVSDTDEEASDRGGTTITIRVTTPTGKQASFPITGFRAKRKN
tara:strand:- start:2329 stop:3774 length:1446 start_codon:yes stop_codon:yes gene_type:complete